MLSSSPRNSVVLLFRQHRIGFQKYPLDMHCNHSELKLNPRICFTRQSDLTTPRDPVVALAADINASRDILEEDKVPQLIVCATMWHETEEEMMEFLKSIVRLDEDQCARRMAKTHLNGGKADDEYYELESMQMGQNMREQMEMEMRMQMQLLSPAVLSGCICIAHLKCVKVKIYASSGCCLQLCL